MEGKDILTDVLKQVLDIRKLLKEAVPRESGISLESVYIGSKRKKILLLHYECGKRETYMLGGMTR